MLPPTVSLCDAFCWAAFFMYVNGVEPARSVVIASSIMRYVWAMVVFVLVEFVADVCAVVVAAEILWFCFNFRRRCRRCGCCCGFVGDLRGLDV